MWRHFQLTRSVSEGYRLPLLTLRVSRSKRTTFYGRAIGSTGTYHVSHGRSTSSIAATLGVRSRGDLRLRARGALVAVRRKYDYVGVFALAFVAGLGGAIIRDGIFLQTGPPAAVQHSGYLLAVLAATLLAVGIDQLNTPLSRIVLVFDALGLGVYAVVGADRSLATGLGHLAAVLVGVINAVGGGMLRDVLTREEPVMFKPGQFYATAAALASVIYVGLRSGVEMNPEPAALIAASIGIAVRLLAVRYDWRTRPWYWWHEQI